MPMSQLFDFDLYITSIEHRTANPAASPLKQTSRKTVKALLGRPTNPGEQQAAVVGPCEREKSIKLIYMLNLKRDPQWIHPFHTHTLTAPSLMVRLRCHHECNLRRSSGNRPVCNILTDRSTKIAPFASQVSTAIVRRYADDSAWPVHGRQKRASKRATNKSIANQALLVLVSWAR